MGWIYGKQEMRDLERAQENCILLTNGLGGFAAVSAAFSVTRNDQGLLIAADVAPVTRITLVQRVRESIRLGEKEICFSTQEFTPEEGRAPEEGYRHLSSLEAGPAPRWIYETEGLILERQLVMEPEENTTAIRYRLSNRSMQPVAFCVEPGILCAPKGAVRREKVPVGWAGDALLCDGHSLYVKTDGKLQRQEPRWEELYFRMDAADGRSDRGLNAFCFCVEFSAEPGETVEGEVIFSDRPIHKNGEQILTDRREQIRREEARIYFRDPVARLLAISADAYVTRRDSTGGKTIVAGYPFFADWGRDTMIAWRGCVLATGRYEDAESILRTFLAYERRGLVPNLFPEGDKPPMYNTVDAALLWIRCVWEYWRKVGRTEFLREAWPTMKRIVEGYRQGTDHSIRMEEDGLIAAGAGLDQVTWMDVCVEGILPTPRHGKPVEINAYWYSALKILAAAAPEMGEDGGVYEAMAERTKQSFLREFWREDAGCLRDVISGTEADEQIRCNQIWALTQPFSMLSAAQERRVLDTVYRELYTPCGLRTLSPKDPQFHPAYGGEQKERDLAYHQGTVWVFPLGAFYRAWLKVHGGSEEACRWVAERLRLLEPMLREGCIGQLPEIYDGQTPGASRGCYAQAWSVGEILTVYELLEQPAIFGRGETRNDEL